MVDDNQRNLQVLGTLLDEKYRTAIAKDGTKALEFVSKRKPDLILLDIMMPDPNGFDVCAKLKASSETREIPIIFLTAKTETEDVLRGFELGAVDYVTKPFRKEELMARVETHLELKQSKEDLKQTLEEYKIAKDTAEKATKAKSEFLARMSHEIRTPMNAVMGMTDLTLHTELTSEQRENLEAVRDSASHLLDIINDVLDLSKIEAGKVELDHTDFDLHNLLRSVIRSFSVQTDKKGIFLKLDQNADLPRYLKGDPVRLRQIMVNLIGNAVKFTETGGITVTVSQEPDTANHPPTTNHQPPTIRFSVTDTGIGIPEDKQKTIFETFSQAGISTAGKYGGTGLGLSICRQILDLMGGEIQVQSEPGKGSTFSFTADFQPGDKDKVQTDSQETAQAVPDKPISSLNILLAEDNLLNAKLAEVFIKRIGHKSAIAYNGKEALEALSRESFDLVLMDLEMPEMNGLEATRQIRNGQAGEQNRNIPIIAMTAHALSEFREKCKEAGMNGFVTKPVNYNTLNEGIQKTMNKLSRTDAPAPEPLIKDEDTVLNRKATLDRIGGDQALLQKLYGIFLKKIPETWENLSQAIKDNDIKNIGFHAHALKGPFGAIGAEICWSLAAQIEAISNKEEIGQIQPIFEKLEGEIAKVMDCIETDI